MVTALDDVKNVVASFGGLCDAYVLKPVEYHVTSKSTQVRSGYLGASG
jgi:hypothetical protein